MPRPYSNRIEIHGDTTLIFTKNSDVIFIDTQIVNYAKEHSWCISKTGYAVARVNNKTVKLHRIIMDLKPREICDHINGNKLDNRKSNLRKCTPHQNSFNCGIAKNNTTGATGVSAAPKGRWRARIMVDRKEICLGYYASFAAAALARRHGEKKYFKDYARVFDVSKHYSAAPRIEVQMEEL